MKNVNLKILVPSILMLLGTMSCKDNGEKGNDPMDNTSIETEESKDVKATGPEPAQQKDTMDISPDSTQASPPTVTKP